MHQVAGSIDQTHCLTADHLHRPSLRPRRTGAGHHTPHITSSPGMKRLVDLNRGALFEDTSGLVGSAPFKLGEGRRQGGPDIEMNRWDIQL